MCLLFGNSTVTGDKGNARFANYGHLRFVSVRFGSHCGHWKTKYMSERFFHFLNFAMNFLKGVVSILLLVSVLLNNVALSKSLH